MKKTRLSTILLLVLTLLCSIFILASCGGGGDNPTPSTPTKLTAPTVVLTDDTAIWSADTSADKFEISIDGNLSYIENSVTSRKLTDGQTFKIRAIGDGTNYTNSDWSNSVTYEKPIFKYTITWKNGDTVLETDTEVSEGTLPTYDGAEPTKVADAQYSYQFAGWTPEVVTANGDVTYTAVFTAVRNKYTITWKNGDTTLETDENVDYGTMPVYNGAEPQKAADTQYVYVFSGWSPVVSEVVGNVTYVAQFTSVPNSYTIVWKNGDNTLETDENVTYGSTPSYDGATPTKDATAQYTYTFSGWTPEISSVTGSVTYQAQFTETLRTYTVTFYSEDGLTVLDTVTVEYGCNAVYSKSTPVKNATEGHTYVFEKWVTTQGGSVADDLTNVIGDRSVYASFKEFVRTVTVYIVSNNTDYGTVSVSTLNNVPYGATITVNGNTITVNGQSVTANANSATAQYTYTFANWTADATVGNDTIITANFSRSVNSYTVTWKNGATVLETDENVAYGTTPVYNGALPIKESDNENIYTFSGWSPAISSVTGDITYVAQFTTTANKHTIIFYDDDGVTELGRVVVGHGETATYPNALPTKESTAQITYTFEKWVTAKDGATEASFANITEDKSVYAKYEESVRTYTVIFIGYTESTEGAELVEIQLSKQEVAYGEAAVEPANHYREGFRFDRWDKTFNIITSDLTVVAEYVKIYTVTFVDYNDSIIDVQIVDEGKNAIAPEVPKRNRYELIGWDRPFVKENEALIFVNINEDLTIKAQYVRTYSVVFIDYNDTILKTQTVREGEDAVAPEVDREGYTLMGWSSSYENVHSDKEVKALYTINVYRVEFTLKDGTKIVQEIIHGRAAEDPRIINPDSVPEAWFDLKQNKGYKFTGWDKSFDFISEDLVITALYEEEIEGPILFVNSQSITMGTNEVSIGIYLSGNYDIYGLEVSVKYNIFLSTVCNITHGLSQTDNTQLEIDYSMGKVKIVTAEKESIVGRREIINIKFSVPSAVMLGDYEIEILDGAYFIDAQMNKIKPYIISGKVTVVG